MGRWEPNARQRLVRAALDLFSEHSYDSTTIAQIAERAGLTKTTFFRHFPDKREVLFAGQDTHSRRLAAELGVHAFYRAFARWTDPTNQQTFTELARQAVDELRAAVAALD